jgi:hypothetical protein
MAATYKPSDGFLYVKTMVKNMPLEDVQTRMLQDIANTMWMAAPWRWSLGSITPFPLVSNTRDYTVSLPGDFLKLQSGYINVAGDTNRPLHITSFLSPDQTTVGQFNDISLIPGTPNKLRINPTPGTLAADQTNTVILLYKKSCPVLTKQNVDTGGILLFDDEWTWVYEEGLLWWAYRYADDDRAGTTTATNDGKIQYNGQKGVFMASLMDMRNGELLPATGDRGDT